MTDNFAIERTRFARMARRNARAYLYKDKVRLKKYFYVLRPLLAIKHIEEGLGILPVRFQDLVDLVAPTRIRQAISNLLELKAQTSELGLGDPIPEIGEFIEGEIGAPRCDLLRSGSAGSVGRQRSSCSIERCIPDRLSRRHSACHITTRCSGHVKSVTPFARRKRRAAIPMPLIWSDRGAMAAEQRRKTWQTCESS